MVTHSDSEGPWLFGEWLPAAGLELDVVKMHEGDELPPLDGYAALLVLGGAMGAYDSATVPWLEPVMALLREAVARDLPTLGVCLGAQLIAHGCGGFVQPGEQGPELGIRLLAKRDVAGNDPVFGPLPMTPVAVQWHFDEIAELPPGATLLASSTRYPHQAFRVGRHVYGVQFHPEAPPELVARWAAKDSDELAQAGLDAELLLAAVDGVADELVEVWRPVLERFAALALAAG